MITTEERESSSDKDQEIERERGIWLASLAVMALQAALIVR